MNCICENIEKGTEFCENRSQHDKKMGKILLNKKTQSTQLPDGSKCRECSKGMPCNTYHKGE